MAFFKLKGLTIEMGQFILVILGHWALLVSIMVHYMLKCLVGFAVCIDTIFKCIAAGID